MPTHPADGVPLDAEQPSSAARAEGLEFNLGKGTSLSSTIAPSFAGARWGLACLAVSLLLLLSTFFPASADGAGFPPISDEIRALTAVPGQPGASAVIVFKDADFRFRDYPTEASSRLEVRVRIKILTEEGLSFGEISIPHSRQLRLDGLRGRTVTSSGAELELPKDAVFRERASRSEKIFITKAAFPGVDVGSVIDYEYTLYWDDFFYLEPWLFHDELPVISSKISYFKPDNLGFQTWGRETSAQKMEVSQSNTHGGLRIEVKMSNLAPLPNEPYSFPLRDLSSRFMIIPTAIQLSGQTIPLLENWREVYRMAEDDYKSLTKRAKPLKEQAKTLAAGAKSPREKAERVYRWVRDELATVGFPYIWVDEERNIKDILETRAATRTEKALVLEVMLDAVGIEADRLWIADRFEGRVDARVANPTWLDIMILRVELEGEEIYLNPTSTTLAFGMLPPHYEDTLAIRLDKKKPEPLITPPSPASWNRRSASLVLTIDDQGKVSGGGTLGLTGHPARQYMEWKDSPEATTEAWQEHLEGVFSGWSIDGVEVVEAIDSRRVDVSWRQEQRAEEVLGDEVSLLPSRPLDLDQPFTLSKKKRLTPVQMAWAKLDDVQLEVTWPEGWVVDSLPEPIGYESPAGRFVVQIGRDDEARKLTYSRTFERSRTEFGGDEYPLVKDLYERASKNDGQELVWILE